PGEPRERTPVGHRRVVETLRTERHEPGEIRLRVEEETALPEGACPADREAVTVVAEEAGSRRDQRGLWNPRELLEGDQSGPQTILIGMNEALLEVVV